MRSEAFRKWFVGSKVVDESGNPLVVHHGTRAEPFYAFSTARAGSRTDHGYLGAGAYFTDRANLASIYGENGWMYPAYLSIKNPLEIAARIDGRREVDREIVIRELLGLPRASTAQDVTRAALAAGHDGVIYTDLFGGREYVAFDAEQIKSIFDTGEPGILDEPMNGRSVTLPHGRTTASDSKVVDENGEPLVVYHGTDRHFDHFSEAAPRHHVNADGPAFYFTTNLEMAKEYARGIGAVSDGGRVLSVYLNLQNPRVATYDEEDDIPRTDFIGEQIDLARDAGNDGLIVLNLDEGQGPETQYVAFDPAQIKIIRSDWHFLTESELQVMETEDLDRIAFGVACGDVVELSPDQICIQYHCDLENPEHKFAAGGMGWANSVDLSEPVEIDVRQDGRFYLVDGHHRWFAAAKTGRKLKAVVEVKANPVKAILDRQAADIRVCEVTASFSEETSEESALRL